MDAMPMILQQKLLVILQRCFHELRNLAPGGHLQQMHDLADTVEILPALMMRWEVKNRDLVREVLALYKSKYAHGYDYLSILDMDDASFRAVFLDYQNSWGMIESEVNGLAPTTSTD
ncbi:MAG: hypothetical protein L0Y71_12285 [Gemmataceae bacterium]|nr:hypothetical protein [Gemmataceae bacterium]